MGSIAKIGYLFYILGFLFCYLMLFKRLIIKLSTKDGNKELRSLEVQKFRSPVITIFPKLEYSIVDGMRHIYNAATPKGVAT